MGLFDGIQRITIGDIAHDTADAGSPVKMGARARSGKISRVSTDDRTHLVANMWGTLIVSTGGNLDANGTSGSVGNAEDMTFATSLGGAYTAVDTNSFTYDQNSWASGHAEQYYRVPMFGFRSASVIAYNALGQLATINLYVSLLPGTSISTVAIVKVASVASVTSGAKVVFAPYAAGPDASTEYVYVEALQSPMGALIVGVDPAVQPSTGECRIYFVRQ